MYTTGSHTESLKFLNVAADILPWIILSIIFLVGLDVMLRFIILGGKHESTNTKHVKKVVQPVEDSQKGMGRQGA
jgi:hypothetical protein